MEHKEKYKKSKDSRGGAGMHGCDYQIDILTLFLLEAYKNEEDFRLSTENIDGGDFDDVVLETTKTTETTKVTILLQAKHKFKSEKSPITYNNLFKLSKKDKDFYIKKYVESFAKIKNNFINIDTLILCTNTDITDEVKKHVSVDKMSDSHIFSFCDKKCYYSFKECKNLICESDDQVQDIDLFLQKFQLISVSDQDIKTRIEKLVKDIDIFDDIDQSLIILKDKVELHFQNEEGIYLIRSHVDAMRSELFIKKLKSCNVNFKINSDLELSEYTCYYIKNKNNINIHLLKIYQQIKEKEVLLVPPFDNRDLKKKVISSFRIDSYEYLIIVVFKEEFSDLTDVIREIEEQVRGKSDKKFIFVSDDTDILESLVEYLKVQAHVFEETISFDQLTDETQNNISSKNIIFQGKQITLCELIHPLTLDFNENILCKSINIDNINIFDYKNKIDYYVTRTLQSETEKGKIFTENDLCDLIVKDTKTILIIDDPGMGKTTLLSNLQKNLIEKFNYLVIKINLNECTRIFKASLDENKQIDVVELLNRNQLGDFEKCLFNLPKKVVILFDAFDEISPNYSILVLDLIKYCEDSENVKKVVLTSRKHCQNDISDKLTFLRFSLNPFPEKDQENFLKNYWTKKLQLTDNEDLQKCGEFMEKLLTNIRKTIGGDSWNFIGVPLQSQMLADIFKNDCSEFIKSNNFKSGSLGKFNIAKLYEQFITEKKRIYIYEKLNVNCNPRVNDKLSKGFDRAIDEEHTKMALRVVFVKSQYKQFGILKDSVEVEIEDLLEMGIVQMSGDDFQFIHRTFAEYLAAKYICNFFNQTRMKKSFSDFLIKKVFLDERYKMLTSFINGILEDRPIPENIFEIFGEYNLVLTERDYKNLLDLAKSRQYNVLKIMLKENRNFISQKTTEDEDLFSETLSNFSIFKILLDKGANIRKIYSDGKTLLHLAAECDSEEVINYLIHENLDVYARDKKGNSPLHTAATYNSARALKILSKTVSDDIKNNYGESKNNEIKNYKGRTPFLMACSYKAFDCAIYLLENGTNINETDNSGRNALHLLAYGGWKYRTDDRYINIFRKLIDRNNRIDLNSVCREGMTAMHYVVENDIIEVLKMLLEQGANKQIKDKEGRTLFLLACFRKALDCVIYLLDNDANINETDNSGRNALHLLAFRGWKYRTDDRYLNIFRQLIDRNCKDLNGACKEGKTAMHYVVENDIIEVLKMLLEHGADKEIKDKKENTPFFLACSEDAFDCAIYLLENDANINETDNTGRNALHLLANFEKCRSTDRYINIFRQLIDRKCIDLNSVYKKSKTAMHYVVENDNIQILKILLEHGADKEIKEYYGKTPFLSACFKNAFDCAIYLLENCANINETDNKGRNALHLLAIDGRKYRTDDRYINIFRQLIDRNCIDLNSVCKKSKTAMHYVARNDIIEVLKMLLEYGANKEIKDIYGKTPFLLACSYKAFDCAIYLLENNANINETDNNGCNALHILFKLVNLTDGGTILVTKLIKLNSINLDDVSNEGLTALQYADRSRNSIMKYLLNQNNDDVVDENL